MEPGKIEASIKLEPTTIGQMVNQLPTGKNVEGSLERGFEFLPMNMGLRKRVGALQGRKDLRGRAGKMICFVLGKSLKTLCGQDMRQKSDDERALMVAQLPVGDVFYLAFCRYHHAHKKGFPLGQFECGTCGASLASVRVDISTMELSKVPDGVDGSKMSCHVGLVDGFDFNGDRYEEIRLKSPRWLDFLWKLTDEQANNGPLIESVLIEASVSGTNIKEGRLAEQAIDELTPDDVDLISKGLDAVVPQVDAHVEFECPSCGSETTIEVPWHVSGF